MMLSPDLPQNFLHLNFMKAIVPIRSFSGPYFPAFWLNTKYWYSVFSPNAGKYEPEKNPNMDMFQAVVELNIKFVVSVALESITYVRRARPIPVTSYVQRWALCSNCPTNV